MKLVRWEKDNMSFFIKSNIELMLLDTGATKSQITSQLGTTPYKILYEDIAHGAFGEKKQKTVELPELIIGDHLVENLPVSVNDSHGIVGMDFFKNTCIHLDFSNDEFSFIDHFDNGNDLFMGESGHFYVMCNFGKINVWALFDTGASATVVNQSFADEHPELFDIISMDTGMDWTGTEHEAQIVSVKNLSLDSICFEEHEAGILDLSNAKKYLEKPIELIIGATTIELAKWDFDFLNRRWKVYS